MKSTYRFSNCIWLLLSAFVIITDQLSKLWVMHNLSFDTPRKIFEFFDLRLAYNTGAAFAFLDGMTGWQTWFFGIVAVIVSIVLLLWLLRLAPSETWLAIALSLVLGGAVGNVIDRAHLGFVVDFLSFHWNDWHFAIFNLADTAVCAGAFMLIIDLLFSKQE